jgi:hypothetical protein
LGRQQNSEIAKQQRDETRAFKDALDAVNDKMRMQQRLDNQRVSELQKADAALAKAQADQAAALNNKKGAFEKALRETQRGMKTLQALRKFKERSLAEEAKGAKSYRSRKFTQASQEGEGTAKETKGSTEARQQRYDNATKAFNPEAYRAGAETIRDFEKRALEAADNSKDKRVGKLLKRAVEDMILAKDNQAKRQEAYDKAADAALEISPEAFDLIDEQLYFLVSKYANK